MITSNTNAKVGHEPAVYTAITNMHPKTECDSDMAAEGIGKKGEKSLRAQLELKLMCKTQEKATTVKQRYNVIYIQ